MAPLVHLLIAACALVAQFHAHSIPVVPLDESIVAVAVEDIKPIPENIPSEQETALLPEAVRAAAENPVEPVEVIPVEVVVENADPSVKLNDVADDEEIKRPEVDLRDPGLPQRQEHETQNPEHYSEELLKLSTIKENIEQTQILLRQGFQGVTADIQNWFSNSEQIKNIQQNIQTLRDSFTNQIQRLNDTLQGLANPEITQQSQEAESKLKADFDKIETRIKILEDNFHNGVKTLSEGVHIVASLRASNDEGIVPAGENPEPAIPAPPASPVPPAEPAPPNPPQNILVQYLGVVQNSVASSLQNVSTAFNNFVSNSPALSNLQNILNPTSSSLPPGVQQDQLTDPTTTTSRPFPWQNWSFGNLLNVGQSQSTQQSQTPAPSTSGPFAQVFQNLPFFNNVVGFIRPSTSTSKPVEATNSGNPLVGNESAGSPSAQQVDKNQEAPANAVIQPAPQPAVQPAPQSAAQLVQPAQPTAQPLGPIRQILNNNPVVQGIAGAVQRFQNAINNPERPRDTPQKNDDTKKGHGGNNAAADNINNSSGVKEKKNEGVIEVKSNVEQPKAQAQSETVADKTE